MPDYIVKDAVILSRIGKMADAIARDPDCDCDDAEAVKIVADHIEAQAAEIKRLKGDLKKAVEAAASAAVDWLHEDYGMSEAKAADLGIYRFVKRATRAALRGGKDDKRQD